MSRERRLVASLTVLATVTVVGTIGYMVIEEAALGDALYMTVLTISTVGFQEVFPLSSAGRFLTTGLIVVGVGAALYTAATALEIGLERLIGGELRKRRMTRELDKVHDHVIVCGFGRVGLNVWKALTSEGVSTVVVEVDHEAAQRCAEIGALVVEGDATHDDTLDAAGIDRARALIACVRNDSDNLVIVLSAKARRSELPVIARATEDESQEKLRLAGADRVVAPQLVGAHRLAALAAEPHLDEFVDVILQGRLVELRIEGIEIHDHSLLVGKALRDAAIREESGALILAVERPGGDIHFNPDPGLKLQSGHLLVAIGSTNQIEALRTHAGHH